MTELAELERRITAALARVDAGIDRLQDSARAAGAAAQDSAGAEAPDLAPPDLTAPNLTADDLTAPDLTAPDLTVPDLTVPDMTGPAHETSDSAPASEVPASAVPASAGPGSVAISNEASGEAPEPASDDDSAAAPDADSSELAELRAALAAERANSAALVDRIRTLKGLDQRQQTAAQARIDQLTKQLDVQGLELNRLRKSMIQLREALRVLREGAEGGTVDAAMINKAMMAEMEALRAARSSESAELDSIIAELATLVGEESSNA